MSDQKLMIGYYRLSMEDDSEGESNSIINQRKLVKDYISIVGNIVCSKFVFNNSFRGSTIECDTA